VPDENIRNDSRRLCIRRGNTKHLMLKLREIKLSVAAVYRRQDM
jgi:hypothetical protein